MTNEEREIFREKMHIIITEDVNKIILFMRKLHDSRKKQFKTWTSNNDDYININNSWFNSVNSSMVINTIQSIVAQTPEDADKFLYNLYPLIKSSTKKIKDWCKYILALGIPEEKKH